MSGARAPQLAPRPRRIERRAGFQVDPRAFGKPRRQVREQRRRRILPEGRIEENHVEALAGAADVGQGFARDQFDVFGAQHLQGLAQLRKGLPVLFHHHHAGGAARGGLEAERAAAGEQIEAGEPVQALAEPIEQRLAHTVGRRPQVGTGADGDAPAAPFAADDADFAWMAFVRMHRSMVTLSWAARLKAGLARTREVLHSPLNDLLARRAVDAALFGELERLLLEADCGVSATAALLAPLRAQRFADGAALKVALRDSIATLLFPLEGKLHVKQHQPLVIMVAGVNGSGKTTSIGKLAKWLQAQGASVLLAAGDTFRAAAREQLVVWGERNNIPVIAQASGDAGAVVFDALGAARARGIDVVIADTAGRLPTQLHLMEEIRKVKRVAARAQAGAPHEVLLVLDANTGQNALAQVKAFDDALRLTGLVITKLDGTAKGGVICAIAKERPVPVLFVGIGEGIDDLRPFVAREFAEAMID